MISSRLTTTNLSSIDPRPIRAAYARAENSDVRNSTAHERAPHPVVNASSAASRRPSVLIMWAAVRSAERTGELVRQTPCRLSHWANSPCRCWGRGAISRLETTRNAPTVASVRTSEPRNVYSRSRWRTISRSRPRGRLSSRVNTSRGSRLRSGHRSSSRRRGSESGCRSARAHGADGCHHRESARRDRAGRTSVRQAYGGHRHQDRTATWARAISASTL